MSTNTYAFIKVNAEYLASKVAADLEQFTCFYGQPTEAWINKYMAELVILLTGGHLESVDYGYKKNDRWTVAVHYKVSPNIGLVRDDSPGKIPHDVDITGSEWGSFLRKNSVFHALPGEEQAKITATLPFSRTGASDPLKGISLSFDDKYSSGGVDFSKSIIK